MHLAEQQHSRLNKALLLERQRQLMRADKQEELLKDITVLDDMHSNQIERKDALIAVLKQVTLLIACWHYCLSDELQHCQTINNLIAPMLTP